MATARVRRGRKTQDIVARYLRDCGWNHAEAVHTDERGRDIKNVLGHAVEVKGRYGFDFPA